MPSTESRPARPQTRGTVLRSFPQPKCELRGCAPRLPPRSLRYRQRRRDAETSAIAPVRVVTARHVARRLPESLDRRFEALVFDWDGTAVPDRATDARELKKLVEEACSLGLHLGIVTGTHIGNVDGQLQARPASTGTPRHMREPRLRALRRGPSRLPPRGAPGSDARRERSSRCSGCADAGDSRVARPSSSSDLAEAEPGGRSTSSRSPSGAIRQSRGSTELLRAVEERL